MSAIRGHHQLLMRGASGESDPYWSYVVALLHFDGPNPGTDSKSGVDWANADASLTTAQKKFGPSSLSLSGSYLDKGNSADFSMFQKAFTWEFWVRPTTSAAMVIADNRLVSGGDSTAFVLYIESGDLCWFSNIVHRGVGKKVTVGEWNHIAVSRGIGTSVNMSSRLRFYIDGVMVYDTIKNDGVLDAPRPFRIGTDIVKGAPFVGQIDEVRITRGAGRYPDEFTPPAAPYPDA